MYITIKKIISLKDTIPKLGISSLLLCSSMVVYTYLHHKPTLSVTENQFSYQQKLNLALQQTKLSLTPTKEFSQPLGMYVYSNYTSDISEYQINVYRATDNDLVYPLAQFVMTKLSPYE